MRPFTSKRKSPGRRKESRGEFFSSSDDTPILAPEVSIRYKTPAGIAPIAMNTWIEPRITDKVFVFFILQK
jgi:hypothetical protein